MKVRERSSGTIRSATTTFCPLSARFSISPRLNGANPPLQSDPKAPSPAYPCNVTTQPSQKKSGLSAAPVDPISAPEIPGGAETA
jgi:hypothetical protein